MKQTIALVALVGPEYEPALAFFVDGRVAVFRDPFANRWDLIERPLDRSALAL